LALSNEQINAGIEGLSRKFRKPERVKIFLSVLGKDLSFLRAIESTVGQEILKDITEEMKEKIELMLQEKSTEEDRAELRAYKRILAKWQAKLIRYNKSEAKFLENAK
jgi:hypothetical protein